MSWRENNIKLIYNNIFFFYFINMSLFKNLIKIVFIEIKWNIFMVCLFK